ncbi:MAG: D-alanyl-D-alanine carboxypeptidase family protein [Candidatus Hodarchaeota archaeon]
MDKEGKEGKEDQQRYLVTRSGPMLSTFERRGKGSTTITALKSAMSMCWLFSLMSCLFLFRGLGDCSHELPVEIQSRSAVLMDGLTGQVIFEKNPEARLSPASFVKMMTLCLAFDALKSGRAKPDQEVLVSEKAWKMGGSQMFLKIGDKVPFIELLKGVAAISANDGSVAIAEFLEGSEDAFVRKMNEKAKTLGLKNTHFVNSHGLFAENQYTTAYDTAILSFHYVKDHADALALHSILEFEYGGIKQQNWNRLLEMDERVDGLKTGYLSDAGYHIVVSAKEGEQRLIAVVMGVNTFLTRDQEALKLLEYGFKNFTTKAVAKRGEIIGKVEVQRGKLPDLDLSAEETVIVTVRKNNAEKIPIKMEIPQFVTAPIMKGQPLGRLIVEQEGIPRKEINLVATADVPTKSYVRFYQLGLLIVIGLLVLAVWRIRALKKRRR